MFARWRNWKAQREARREAQLAEWEREWTLDAAKTRADVLALFREIADPIVADGAAKLSWDAEREMLTLLPVKEDAAPLRLQLPPWPTWGDVPKDFEGNVTLFTGPEQHAVNVGCWNRYDDGWAPSDDYSILEHASLLRSLIRAVLDGGYHEEVSADGRTVTLVFSEVWFYLKDHRVKIDLTGRAATPGVHHFAPYRTEVS